MSFISREIGQHLSFGNVLCYDDLLLPTWVRAIYLKSVLAFSSSCRYFNWPWISFWGPSFFACHPTPSSSEKNPVRVVPVSSQELELSSGCIPKHLLP